MQLGLQQLLVWQTGLIFGDQGRRKGAIQRVLNHLILFAGTQQYTNRRILVSLSVVSVEGLEVEIELAQVFGFKARDFQLDGQEAIKTAMKK